MEDVKKLESQYLKAKIAYYEGNPIMTDSEFDSLEQILIKAGSKVHEQVGSKRKDFDFPHPTKMLSLAKIQTEKEDLKFNEFYAWFEKRVNQLGLFPRNVPLLASPKFDGSAINIIYRDGKLENILTRGDGISGKNLTKRLKSKLPEKIIFDTIVEIRCEVVIDKTIFQEKYAEEFANARNFVAGVLGKDDYSEEKVADLTIIPLQFLIDGKHSDRNHFLKHFPEFKDWNEIISYSEYDNLIKRYEKIRKDISYQLDGVVIAFPEYFREELGENEHDPEWAIAIKFVPEGAVTKVVGIEWNIGKRGQLTPVVQLEPVQLAGTTVKRASGYNAGFLYNNKIGIGSVVSIEKAGDIIPEIVNIIVYSDILKLPKNCPECGSNLEFDDVHLICPNEKCSGKISKILAYGAGVLDLKGIGGERLKPFAHDYKNIYEIWQNTLIHGEDFPDKYEIPKGTRLNEIFVNAFKNIKSIPYEKVIQCLGYENVGKKISIQLAKEHCGLEPDYTGLERALVDKLHTPDIESYIKGAVSDLEALGVTVDRPEVPNTNSDSIRVTLTGSPKAFGYKTKAEFLAKYPNLFEVDLKDAKYLVTDDLNSTSSKMTNAKKKGIEIKTYGDF